MILGRFPYRVLACILILQQGACITSAPEDVQFVSVQAVDEYNQPEIRIASREDLYRYGLRTDQLGPTNDRPHRLVLKIGFRTRTDLWDFALARGYNLGAWANFCDMPDQKVLLTSTWVYWNRRRVDLLKHNLISEYSTFREGDRIEYYMFAEVENPGAKPNYAPFDLRKDTKDICIYLAGGGSMRGYRSNTFVVPKEEINIALRDLPPFFDD